MIDPEIRERSFALGRLVAAMAHREPYDHGGAIPDQELSWNASEFVARLVNEAIWLAQPLSEKEASDLIGEARFQELRTRQLVRTVLDSVEVLSSRDVDDADHPDQQVASDLKKIREAAWDENRKRLWISESNLRALFDVHSAQHPSMLPWGAIITTFEAYAREDVAGYAFRVGRHATENWFDSAFSNACARLWISMIDGDSRRDVDVLRTWLSYTGDAFDASVYIPRPARERLVAAAFVLLTTDPNLGDVDTELRSPLIRQRSRPSYVIDSTAAVHLMLEDVDDGTRMGFWDESRAQLSRLTLIILKYDGDMLGVPTRILDVAECGQQKPYLLHMLTSMLPRNRPEAIAWLLTRTSTAALGLVLLRGLSLQEPTIMDEWNLRETRTHARSMVLLKEALPIYIRAIGLSLAGGHALYVATSILDLLRALARMCVRRSLFNDAQHTLAHQHACEVYSFVESTLITAEPSHRILSPEQEHVPRLLSGCAVELIQQLDLRIPATERSEYLRIAHGLLRFLHENQAAFSEHATGTVDLLLLTVATQIRRRYVESFDIDQSDSFRHFFRLGTMAELLWGYTACVLQEHNELPSWVHLSKLQAKILSTVDLAAAATEDTLAGCASRLRMHLEVLLRTHGLIQGVLSATRTTRDQARAIIEQAIETLILSKTEPAKGEVDLFDRQLVVSWEDEVGTLIRLAVRTILTFSDEASERIIRAWIVKTNDPSILLDMEKDLQSPAHVKVIQEKMIDPGVLERAENDRWLTAITDMAYEAASSNHGLLAERLLKRGDDVTVHHPWRARWDLVAFRSRLVIAYHRGDRAAIEGLELPETSVGTTAAAVEQRRAMKQSQDFYRALLDLSSDPEAARVTFARLLSHEPDSSSLLINLFAARLQVAKGVQDQSSRRQAYEDALRWWDGVRAKARDRGDLDSHGPLNELLALDGAELDDEFDARWTHLDDSLRTRIAFVGLRLENLKRRGMREEQSRVLIAAQSRYGAALPEGMASLRLPEPAAVPERLITVDAYRSHWGSIRGLPPQELSLVVGPTRQRDLAGYLLHVHVTACLEMLTRFPTISLLRDENKLNDLVVSYVRMQLGLLDWTVHDQTRGGLSASGGTSQGGGVGERDWVVQSQTREIYVCEALRLSSVDSTVIEKHVGKLVERYNPQGAPHSLVVVYYEGTNFDDFADRYKPVATTVTLPTWTLAQADDWRSFESTRIKSFRLVARKGSAAVSQDHILVDVGPPS